MTLKEYRKQKLKEFEEKFEDEYNDIYAPNAVELEEWLSQAIEGAWEAKKYKYTCFHCGGDMEVKECDHSR